MKILHTVEFYYPSTGGMQEVVKQISEQLAGLGHDVSVATSKIDNRFNNSINGVKIIEFDIHGSYAFGIQGDIQAYRDFLLESDYDVITNFAAQQWATDLMLEIFDDVKGTKVFVPTGFSGLYMPQWSDYFDKMKLWMKKYDMNVFLSHDYRDINFARANGIKSISFIPNGASESEFLAPHSINIREVLQIPGNDFLILHVGSHTGGKGHLEAIQIFSEARIKNATLLIIGDILPVGCATSCIEAQNIFSSSVKMREDNKKLIIASLERKETVAAYQEADLFLFPSNIECSPIVLFECMASQTPFLTTDVGNSSEIIAWSRGGELLPTLKSVHGFCRADIKGSAALLEQLYYEPDRRFQMAANGYKAWISNFTWEKIALRYENMYEELLKKRTSAKGDCVL